MSHAAALIFLGELLPEFQIITALPPEDIFLKTMDGNDDGLVDSGEFMQVQLSICIILAQ